MNTYISNSMNVYTRVLSLLGILTLLSMSTYGQVETPETPADPDPVEAPTDEETLVSDTVEVRMKNRKYVIITDDDGRRIEIKNNEIEIGDEESTGDDEEFDWDDFTDDEDDLFDEEAKDRDGGKQTEVDLVGLDLGITNYFVDGTYGASAASPDLALREFRPGAHVGLYILPTNVSLIGRGAVGIKTALTIDWNNYYFTEDITLGEDENGLTVNRPGTLFSKNKLMVRYFQIPLMLTFNTRPGTDDGVRIGVGGYGGLLWGARTKQISDEDGTQKVKGDFGLNPYRYGLMARFDFSWFDIYLHYNLSTMFEENRGPSTQTFVAGLNIIHF